MEKYKKIYVSGFRLDILDKYETYAPVCDSGGLDFSLCHLAGAKFCERGENIHICFLSLAYRVLKAYCLWLTPRTDA
jgi:hypothetical protein